MKNFNLHWQPIIVAICLFVGITACTDETAQIQPDDDAEALSLNDLELDTQISDELKDALHTAAQLPPSPSNARLGDMFTYDLVTTAGVPTIFQEFLEEPVRTEGVLKLTQVRTIQRGELVISGGDATIGRVFGGTFTYEGGESPASLVVSRGSGSLFYTLYIEEVPGTLRPVFISLEGLRRDISTFTGQIIAGDPEFGLLGPNTVVLATQFEGTFTGFTPAE